MLQLGSCNRIWEASHACNACCGVGISALTVLPFPALAQQCALRRGTYTGSGDKCWVMTEAWTWVRSANVLRCSGCEKGEKISSGGL